MTSEIVPRFVFDAQIFKLEVKLCKISHQDTNTFQSTFNHLLGHMDINNGVKEKQNMKNYICLPKAHIENDATRGRVKKGRLLL